jgi:hypothetical protein
MRVRELVGEDPERPKVKLKTALLLADELRSQIEVGSRIDASFLIVVEFFGYSEICEFTVPVTEEENIFGLEIAIEDAFVVELLKGKDDTSDYKPHASFSCFFE